MLCGLKSRDRNGVVLDIAAVIGRSVGLDRRVRPDHGTEPADECPATEQVQNEDCMNCRVAAMLGDQGRRDMPTKKIGMKINISAVLASIAINTNSTVIARANLNICEVISQISTCGGASRPVRKWLAPPGPRAPWSVHATAVLKCMEPDGA
jgi:hypothetical protein